MTDAFSNNDLGAAAQAPLTIKRPVVTVIPADDTGFTYEVSNDGWMVKYKRRGHVDMRKTAQIKARNFAKYFNNAAKAIEDGKCYPYHIMREFVDDKRFESIPVGRVEVNDDI